MTGTVRLYFNTGFNGVDIPFSRDVLDIARYLDFPQVYFTREDYDKPWIDLAAAYTTVRDADYMRFTTTESSDIRYVYYFVKPTPLAKGVTRLYLEMDALLTMGGASMLTYISGWQVRGHVSKADDVLFGNCASEDWLPTKPLEVAHVEKVGNRRPTDVWADVDVVLSAVDLGKFGDSGQLTTEVIEGMVSGDSEAKMWFPAVPMVSTGSTYKTWDFSDNMYKSFSIPASGAFQILAADDRVWRGLEKLYACGQLQLQASYKIPGEYLDPNGGANPVQTQGNQGKISEIRGVHKALTMSSMPYEYTVDNGQYTVKNKKCFTTYRQYVIVALGTSDTSIQDASLLYDGQSTAPTIWIWSDPTSTGKPYARFSFIKGNPILYSDAVKGLPWVTNQIAMTGASGSVWNALNAGFANAAAMRDQQRVLNSQYYGTRGRELQVDRTMMEYRAGMFGSAGGTIGSLIGLGASAFDPSANPVATGINALATTAKGVTDMMRQNALLGPQLKQIDIAQKEATANNSLDLSRIEQEINQNSIGLLQSNGIVAPTLLFSPEQNLGLYGYNYFQVYEVRKSDEDLKSEDAYYQRYGYNGLHRPLTAQCFSERTYFSYVQAYDINIKSPFPMRMRQKAIAQLNRGVRVWRTLPNASLYDAN